MSASPLDGMPPSRLGYPLDIIQRATREVPFVRYALAIVGVAAALSLTISFFSSPVAAVIGVGVMLALMALVFIFAKMTEAENRDIRPVAKCLMWFMAILFMSWSSLTTTCVFFDKPKTYPDFLGVLFGTQADRRPSTLGQAHKAFEFKATSIGVADLPDELRAPVDASAGNSLKQRPKLILDAAILNFPFHQSQTTYAIYAQSIELKNGARIKTNGNNVNFFFDTIDGSGGTIESFDAAVKQAPASPALIEGTRGRDAGNVTLDGAALVGRLSINLSGQKGG